MKIEAYRLYSKIWLTTKPEKQKYQHRDDIIRVTLEIINKHPETEELKKILMNEECYLINLHYEKDNPNPKKKSGDKKIIRSYFIVNHWYVTDLNHTLNVTPIYFRYGFPACALEIIDKNAFSDKLNEIIATEVFSAVDSLTEYEKRLGEIFREYL